MKGRSIKAKNKKKNFKFIKYILLYTIIGFALIFGTFIYNKTISTVPTNNSSEIIKNNETFTVTLDAGHGDWDYGAIGVSDSLEKDIVLDITLKIGKILEKYGINVVYTRTGDNLTWSDNSTQNLYERVNISKAHNSNLFVSIHCNATDESASYNGIETWYNPASVSSEEFATIIQDELSSLEYTYDRGIKYYNEYSTLAVLEHNPATSVLIELGFISNFSDEGFLTSKNGQTKISQAIANAILTYKNNLE